ncbi:hypothetical protein SDC9_204981 [bioreactor metagenome]|uniref:Methyl-accepting chemotaxis protein IV n=1 Tax=bioreactor metagenome TaxID=1076179 RepID=A0A645J1K7_9ZZZZ
MEGISQTGELIGAIATSSNEQAAALEQINQGIMQISQVVQSNAASAEESAAASEELSAQADSLKEYVSVFKLSGNPIVRNETAHLIGETSENMMTKKASSKDEISLANHNLGKY